MPAEFTMSLETKVAMAETIKTLIDSGGAAGAIELRTLADVLLATVPLAYPCGEVDPLTGNLVFDQGSVALSVATGVANKALFLDSEGAQVFTSNVSNKTGSAFVRIDSVTVQAVGQPVSVTAGTMEF